MRLDGIHPFNPNFRALYTAEYAKQTDYSGGDSRINADYYKIGGGLGVDNLNIRVDQELLGSNDSKYAFQTPFGTNHLFQGWTDKFLATPLEGIEDSFVTATYRYSDFVFFYPPNFLLEHDRSKRRSNDPPGDAGPQLLRRDPLSPTTGSAMASGIHTRARSVWFRPGGSRQCR